MLVNGWREIESESESEGRWSHWIYESQRGMGSEPKASFWLRGTHASFLEKEAGSWLYSGGGDTD